MPNGDEDDRQRGAGWVTPVRGWLPPSNRPQNAISAACSLLVWGFLGVRGLLRCSGGVLTGVELCASGVGPGGELGQDLILEPEEVVDRTVDRRRPAHRTGFDIDDARRNA